MSLSLPVASLAGHPYFGGMLVRIARLLALFALVLMPLSMASTPATAQPAASAAAGHCDEHPQPKPADSPSNAKMHCTGCTALPAMEAPAPIAELRPQAPMQLRPAEFVDGIEPETATPPPRIS